ncbi:hypothetical protein PYW07_005252 [Mythimna separata]|uniref:Uncharacterized protein n=1 Tax=Mythimna separata TaxID=271217 RepID=A0AAD7YE69_MYTSE|nr:hypothetical protein PYW07_005252 [Mythimna separata]
MAQDIGSNDNSISTKEFLQFEKSCEASKDDDEEIRMIFNEIKKLSAANKEEKILSEDIDDVDLILKRAEDIAHETENLLKSSPISAALNTSSPNKSESGAIPQIKVTKPSENEKDSMEHKEFNNTKVMFYYYKSNGSFVLCLSLYLVEACLCFLRHLAYENNIIK